MGKELQALIHEYSSRKGVASQRVLAKLEAAIWKAAKSEPGFHGERKTWLRKTLGCGNHQSQTRNALLRLGDAAEPLWKLLEVEKVEIGSVELILRESKALARTESVPLVHAIDLKVKEFRAGKIKRQPRKAGVRPATNKLRQSVKAAFSEFIAWRLDIDSPEASTVGRFAQTTLHAEVDQVIDSMSYLFEDRPKANHPGRDDVVEACFILGISKPIPGAPLNMRSVAARKRKLARLHHPDVVKDDSDAAVFRAIIDAYAIVVAYNESLGKAS